LTSFATNRAGRPVRRTARQGLRLVLALSGMLTLTGCVSRYPAPPADLLSVIGDGASAYVVIPVRQNQAFVSAMAARFVGVDASRDLAARARMVYLGSFPDAASTADSVTQRPAFRALVTGDFPAFASFALTQKRGWTRRHDADLGDWYASAQADLALPTPNLVCLSGGEGQLKALLANLAEPKTGSVPDTVPTAGQTPAAPTLSASFRDWGRIAVDDGRIGIYLSDLAPLFATMLGDGVSLPARNAEFYAQPTDSGDYSVSGVLAAADARSARALGAVLRFLPGATVNLDGETIRVRGWRLSAAELAEIAGSLYFKGAE